MNRRWKRSSLKITTGLILSAVLSSQGFSHDPISLYDIYGNKEIDVIDNQTDYSDLFDTNSTNSTIQVLDNNNNTVTLYKGTPISFEETCGKCHENIISDIRASHHGAVGLHDMGWMDGETKGDDTGAKDFVANKVLRMRYFRSKSHYGGW
jgi:hypothetical protein